MEWDSSEESAFTLGLNISAEIGVTLLMFVAVNRKIKESEAPKVHHNYYNYYYSSIIKLFTRVLKELFPQ